MRLEMGCIDHDRLMICMFRSQSFHDASKHPHVAPSYAPSPPIEFADFGSV